MSQPTIRPGEIFNITIANSFSGGDVIVDGDTKQSGITYPWPVNEIHTIVAIDQDWPSQNNYFREFENWFNPEGFNVSTTHSYTFNVPQNDGAFTANFKTGYNFDVSNNFFNGGSGGTLNINGSPVPAPYNELIFDDESRTVEAPVQTQNVNGKNIDYNFIDWDGGSTVNPRIFIAPTDHINVTANYKGHIVASQTGAHTFNNQRKMVYDVSTYH